MPAIVENQPVDPDALRRAISMFADDDGWAPLGRVSGAYKVLTPGVPLHNMSLDSIQAGAPGAVEIQPGSHAPKLRAVDPLPRPEPLTWADAFDLAFEYGQRVQGAAPGSAEWGATVSAMRWLLPDADFGNKARGLRKWLLDTGRWKLERPGYGDDRLMIRRLSERQWAREIWWFPPGDDGGRMDPWIAPDFAHAVAKLRSLPTYCVADGTRVLFVRAPDRRYDLTAFYDRAADAWKRADGGPLPKVYRFDLDEPWLLEDELTDAQRAIAAQLDARKGGAR